MSHHLLSEALAFFLSSLWDNFLLTLAQPSAMGGSSERGVVQASQIKPLGKGGKKGGKDSKHSAMPGP